MFDSLKITTSYLSFYCIWFKTVLNNKCKEFSRIVCVSLFSYQGRLSCDSLFTLSHLFRFVKNFFQAFFRSFFNSSGFPESFSDVRLSALFKRLDYFNTFVSNCQALFLISFLFQKSFQIVSFKETIISDSSTNITPKNHNVNS